MEHRTELMFLFYLSPARGNDTKKKKEKKTYIADVPKTRNKNTSTNNVLNWSKHM